MFGEIKAKDYFKYFPKIYNEIFNGYDEKRKERLLYELKIYNESLFATHFKKMSANKYYKDCALAFKLFDKYNYKLSHEKNFYKNVDGRVQGLNEIDADSKKEFDKWFKENERFFDHTFEIFPGSSRYRIYLYIDKDDDGYYYRLIGINNDTLLDIGKIFLEFLKHGIRVEVSNSFKFIDFLKGEFVFKVVPSYSTYSHYFEQLCVEDLRYKKFIQSIKWHEPHIAKFKNKSK